MKKLILVISLISLAALIAINAPLSLHAQEATDSAADQIRDAIKEKVKERIQNVTTRRVGLVGIIEKITENTILLSNAQNKLTITTDDTTQYLKFPGQRTLKRSELELNQYAIVLGLQPSDSDEVSAKMIQLIKEPEIPKRITVYGTISQINNTSITVTTPQDQTWQINLSRSTDYSERTSNNKTKTIKFSSLDKGDLVVAGGTPDENQNFTLKGLIVLRLPQPPTPTDTSSPSEAGSSAKTE